MVFLKRCDADMEILWAGTSRYLAERQLFSVFFIWTLRRDQTDGPTRPTPASSHQCRPSGPGRWAGTSWQPPLLTDGTAAAARSTLTVGVSGRGWESRTRLVRRGGPPVPGLCRLMGWVNSIWSLSLIFVKCFGLFFLFIYFFYWQFYGWG